MYKMFRGHFKHLEIMNVKEDCEAKGGIVDLRKYRQKNEHVEGIFLRETYRCDWKIFRDFRTDFRQMKHARHNSTA